MDALAALVSPKKQSRRKCLTSLSECIAVGRAPLRAAGSSWHDWRKFNAASYQSPAVHAFKQRAKEIFEAEFGKAPLPVLKDPRICRFVTFWIDVFKEIEAAPRLFRSVRL
jgi:hypothetical protein